MKTSQQKQEALLELAKRRQKDRRDGYLCLSEIHSGYYECDHEKMFGLIEELSGEVMRAVYNRASLATHVHQSKSEVQQIKRYVDTVLLDLLEITQ